MNSKTIQLQFAAVIAKAIQTATGRTANVEVTLISQTDYSVLCDSVADLNEATRFLSCVPGHALESIALDPEIGAIAYYKF